MLILYLNGLTIDFLTSTISKPLKFSLGYGQILRNPKLGYSLLSARKSILESIYIQGTSKLTKDSGFLNLDIIEVAIYTKKF